MSQRPFFSIAAFSLICLAGASLSGCVVANRPYGGYVYGSPAPVMYSYHYYPDAEVYYDVSTGVYFYLSSSGGWIQTRVLPPGLRIRLGSYVPIRSQYQRPYRDFDKHRRTYPPRYREREQYQDRNEYRNNSYPRYQTPPQYRRDSDQRYDQRGYSPDNRDRRFQKEPEYNNRERQYEQRPVQRAEPPRNIPFDKKALKNREKKYEQNKKQNKNKNSGKDKKREAKGKNKGKDKNNRRDDRSGTTDDQRNSDRNRDRDRLDR